MMLLCDIIERVRKLDPHNILEGNKLPNNILNDDKVIIIPFI